jgi:hypothetical protein
LQVEPLGCDEQLTDKAGDSWLAIALTKQKPYADTKSRRRYLCIFTDDFDCLGPDRFSGQGGRGLLLPRNVLLQNRWEDDVQRHSISEGFAFCTDLKTRPRCAEIRQCRLGYVERPRV